MRTLRVAAVLGFTFLFGSIVGARVQDLDGIIVTVPFDFVAGGATLPAGQYKINRANPGANRELVIHSYINGGEFVLPVRFDRVLTNQPTLTFEHIGDRYFLSKIKTLGGVYSVKTSPERIAVTQAESHNALSSSGAN